MSIRTQLIAGIVIITIAAIGFIGIISIAIIENTAIYGKTKEAEKIAAVLAAALTDSRKKTDMDYIKRLVKVSAVSAIEIKDEKGGVIFSEQKLPENRGDILLSAAGVRIYKGDGGFFKEPTYLYATVAADGVEAAFTLSLQDINLNASRVRKFIIFYAIADSVIIVAFGIYFLSYFIIGPVKRLTHTARRISGGELGVRADVMGEGEVAALSRSFNTMADRIEEEIKRLERVNKELFLTRENLVRSYSLASTGRLAAGVAHEVGNPLGAVRGYLDILKKGAVDKDEEKEIIIRCDKEIERIDSIVREFLNLSRPVNEPLKKTDVNAVVKETVELMRHHKLFSLIAFETQFSEGAMYAMINENKLRQVFTNILLNAAEAMKQGGAVIVRTFLSVKEIGQDRRKNDIVFVRGKAVKECVNIEFSDTGCGMSADVIERIFEPFFTTKEPSTGLGLFVSQNIIKAYGGDMEVSSEPGKGSRFRVILPSGDKDEGARS